jgi:pSer/pThr/pTyr-binding forkhead associated (FHA) protein
VQVSLRPGEDLAEDEVRIRCRIAASPKAEAEAGGCLELLSNGRRWPLPSGTTTLGRQAGSDIQLGPQHSGRGRQQLPLISGQHAYVVVNDGQARLFDGSTLGRPSLNGTFVNGQRVQAAGRPLADGDVIVLAPLDPRDPRPAGPGIIALQYHARCPHE